MLKVCDGCKDGIQIKMGHPLAQNRAENRAENGAALAPFCASGAILTKRS